MRRFALVALLPLLAGSVAPVHTPTKPKKDETKRFRLELLVDKGQPGTFFTAWADGDAIADHDGSDGKTVTYHRHFYWSDGCRWESTERIIPTSAKRYEYSYREGAVSCPKGKTADPNVTRSGHIDVHVVETDEAVTPLDAWAAGWEQPPS